MIFFNPISESWIYKLYKQKNMKTAMQELIIKIDLKCIDEYDSEVLQSLSDLRQEATKLLEKEKEQIMNAFSRGLGTELSDWEDSQQYYDRIYNQNK
jgi:hypothetical protein